MSVQNAADAIGREGQGSPVPPVPVATSAREIRWRACCGMVVMAGVVAGLNLAYGRAGSWALVAGLGAGVVGGVGWWAYHLVSRRRDGLIFLSGCIGPFADGRNYPSLGMIASLAVAAVGLGVVFGVWLRVWPPRPGRSRS